MKNIRLKHLTVIIIPILIIAGWAGFHWYRLQVGTVIELQIGGFDPRDLLSGHYLTYRVDYGDNLKCGTYGEHCLCLKASGEISKMDFEGSCDKMHSCNGVFLKGRCEGTRFVAGIERYYFPEQHANQLTVVPPQSTIVVTVSSQGDGTVKDLKVGGEPLKKWLIESAPK